jgi:hypothetical protein
MVKWLFIAFAGGVSVGVMAAGRFTADWVEATGTWAAAIATVGAIYWAVVSFRRETQHRLEALDREVQEREDVESARLILEQRLADDFRVRCYGGTGYGPDGDKTMQTVYVEFTNGMRDSVTIVDFSLPGITFADAVLVELPASIPPGEPSETKVRIADLKAPDNQFSHRLLTLSTPVVRYRVSGTTWERNGDDPPLRVDSDE